MCIRDRHNEGQKQEITLGDKNNQHFVAIPYLKFITILKTLAAKCGIAVVVREESYTSRANLLDMDDIPTYKQGDDVKYQFSGKRIHRGLYRAGTVSYTHLDVYKRQVYDRRPTGA